MIRLMVTVQAAPPGTSPSGRRKHQLDAEGVANCEVGLERPRIPLEIVLAIELQRVDEDADDHVVAVLPGCFDQSGMSLVERPHRRHESHSVTRETMVLPPRADARDGLATAALIWRVSGPLRQEPGSRAAGIGPPARRCVGLCRGDERRRACAYWCTNDGTKPSNSPSMS